MYPFLVAALTSGLLVSGTAARTPQPPQNPATYVGADACKGCHAVQYDAWSKTKHARALRALSVEEQGSAKCIKCHSTGPAALTGAEASASEQVNVQCEACHGPGSAHVNAAKAGEKLVKTAAIEESTCTRCHSEESPHFKYFSFFGMKNFVHPKGSH